ncbi:hypothetical protein FHT02_003956 [Sphingomonas xinjiangensis]|uniref:Uncharacterized protein n=1 Tax=Sphingomonas xinjiangensis TaxID=643568 RepID=A0A840YSM7_9SPHN|nr:hypothetical protein [Sphingomonas xinjiangensis]
MAEDPTFCRDRVREQREAAKPITVVNVRNRCTLSAETWERMAKRGKLIGGRQADRSIATAGAQ